MVNYNGSIKQSSEVVVETNRGFLYGDAVFETLRVTQSILFLEEHYLRLMAAMRICRMDIPMNFTMEYFEEQIMLLVQHLEKSPAYRIRCTVFRDAKGFYTPDTNAASFIISALPLTNETYQTNAKPYEVELYKDFHVTKHLLATLKTTNKMIHTLAGIFAKENDYQNCLLINEDKNIVEAIQGNVFMKIGAKVCTPPISDGCINGVLRKQVIKLLKADTTIEFEERSISPFELQKADELFLSNVIMGIQPITKYRKKEYENTFAVALTHQLNESIN